MSYSASAPASFRQRFVRVFVRDRSLYALLAAPMLFILLFKYLPMVWISIAFQDFNIFKGLGGSRWVGLKHFETLLGSPDFWNVFRNTFLINVYRITFIFPVPIVIALLLNEVRHSLFKRVVQMVVYLPHFLSWVVISALFIQILSTDGGMVNQFLGLFGAKPIAFLMDSRYFRTVLVVTAAWKDVGWNSIIYLAAITGIDPHLYEAAEVDGAGRFAKMRYVTMPGIASTVVVLLLLRMGQILNSFFDQVLVFYNPLVYDVGDVIGTYVYRIGLGKMEYSFGTAVGLFNSLIGFTLIIGANWVTKRISDRSIW